MDISKEKTFSYTIYKCSCCNYETRVQQHASRHKTSTKCSEPNIRKESRLAMDVKDVMEMFASMSAISITGDHNTVDQSTNITINLTVPDKSVVSSVYDAVKNPDCVRELKYADPQEIPAILFKYTRGTCADRQYIKYDPDKNTVLHKDPVTGKEVAKDLKKYRNEYLVKNADVYDDTYHIQYMPKEIQRNMNELARPAFDTGKKKDDPIPAANVIKMCASGDHRMYKLPHDSKKFYTDVVDNVDREIKLT